MSISKGCHVYARRPSADLYNSDVSVTSTILEDRYKEGAVLFESGAIVTLSPSDLALRKMHYTKVLDAYACIGVITSPTIASNSINDTHLSYLVMVSGCTLVGKLPDHEVYRINDVTFICIVQSTNDEDLSDVRKLLSSEWFYYARFRASGLPFDLSVNIQSRYKLNGASSNQLHTRTDVGYNFLWNAGLMGPFLQWSVNPLDWVVPIICGSYEINTVYCGGDQARVGIVSRLSSQRPGTRFNARGANDNGNVANFVETEQFIYLEKSVVSYIHLRGTVPLFWEQPGLQVGSHKINLRRDVKQSINAFDRHFAGIISHYGVPVVVNLLGSKKGEQTLSQAFQEAHRLSAFSGSIPHVKFDYHSKVSTGGEKILQSLLKDLDQWVSQHGYFCARDGRIEKCQKGVLRVNCVDCLDRTNSVQTLVGMNLVLPQMLYQLKSCTTNQSIVHRRFVDSMRRIWQLTGDRISRIYVGTGVLSCGGSSRFKDVRRSAVRTIQQNFFDSAKHESMRALLKNCSVHGWMQWFIDQYIPRQLQHLPPLLLTTLMSRHEEFVEKHPLRLFVGTWNVNGGKRFQSVLHSRDSVADWLLDLHRTVKYEYNWGYLNPAYSSPASFDRPADIFAIGFQEIVDLTTSNIVAGSKASKNQQLWGNLLFRHLNSRQHPRDAFLLITSVQLVGVCLYLFVRTRLAHHIREISTASVKTGLGGTAGNKGAVAIRFQLGATSVCVVCSHFAAGQSAVRERNDDFNEICRRLRLPNGRSLFCHDYLFWCGDFNYRINLPAVEVKRLVAQHDWTRLLELDQLNLERRAQNVFHGFQEGPVRFSPTYKYDLFCDVYDTSEKARSPAWTDRVLWRRTLLQFPMLDVNGVPIKPCQPTGWSAGRLVVYNRSELRVSDHRPVGAIFDVEFHVPIPDEVASATVYERFQFLESLKVIGKVKSITVLCVCRLESNRFLLVYSNPTQARLAAATLDGLVTACSITAPEPYNACEFHLAARVHLPTPRDFDPIQHLETLVEVAEQEDAMVHTPLPSADIFESLPFEKAESGETVAVDAVEGYEVEEEDEDDEDNGLELAATCLLGTVTVPPPVPPRPTAPLISPLDWTSEAPVVQHINNLTIAPAQLLSASVNTSPVHSTISMGSPSPGAPLHTMGCDPQMISSCFDLSNTDLDVPSVRERPPTRNVSAILFPSVNEMHLLSPDDPVDLTPMTDLRTEWFCLEDPLGDAHVNAHLQSQTKSNTSTDLINLNEIRPQAPTRPPPIPPRPDLENKK